MKNEPIVKAKSIIPKNKQNQNYSNKYDNRRESFKMKDNNKNSKVTKIQDKNINGNYGRIYIQDGQKMQSGYPQNNINTINMYSKKYTQEPSNNNRLRGNQNSNLPNNNNYGNKNTYVNNKPKYNQNNNHTSRYSNSVDNNINKYRDRERGNEKYNLRRKSFDRGENYNNIQITHIIYTSRDDVEFHIIDPLSITTEESRRKYKSKIDKGNRNGRRGDVKVTFRSSCDNIKIIPKEKKSNVGKIEIIPHRMQPKQNNNIRSNNIGNSYSMMSRQRNKNKNNNNY